MFPLLPTGSSFGDIVAAAGLAIKLFKALSDSTGSSFEYQALVEEFDSLSNVFKLTDFAVRSTPLSQTVLEGIATEGSRCRSLLEILWEKVKGYQKALGKGGSATSWRKIGWGLFKADEPVVAFRVKLSAHRETMALLLTSSVLGTVGQVADELRQNQPAPKIGYDLENAVVIVDALGENLTLPMALCRDCKLLLKFALRVSLARTLFGKGYTIYRRIIANMSWIPRTGKKP